MAYGQSIEADELINDGRRDSLYIQSIANYVDYLDSLVSRKLYIQKESYLNRIPKKINGYRIVMVDKKKRNKHFLRNKSSLGLIKISPLFSKDSLYSISLLPYKAELKQDGEMDFNYTYFYRTYFKISEDEWVVDRTERGNVKD